MYIDARKESDEKNHQEIFNRTKRSLTAVIAFPSQAAIASSNKRSLSSFERYLSSKYSFNTITRYQQVKHHKKSVLSKIFKKTE